MTYDLEIQHGSGGCWLRYMCMQNFIKLGAAVHELSCPQAMVKNLGPVTLNYDLEIQ